MTTDSTRSGTGKTWKCRIGWHQWVRRAGHDDPSDQVCVRCRKTRSASGFGPMSGGEGGSAMGGG